MMLRDGDPSNASVRSHNSGKDSGTGDSMPSDAYHMTATGSVYRGQFPNQLHTGTVS